MNCPYCKASDDAYHHKVTNRYDHKNGSVRRRRECWNCGRRFNTVEDYYFDDKKTTQNS